MRIAFDLRWIRDVHIDGISRYAINLILHLLQLDAEHEYLLVGNEAVLQNYLDITVFPHAQIVAGMPALLSVRDFLLSPRAMERLDINVLHVPNYLTSPFKGNYKKILTVYDLIPFFFPEALSKSRLLWRWFYKTTYPAAHILRSADVIITLSTNTKQDLTRLLKIPPEKIRVIWSGLEHRFSSNYHISDEFYHTYRLPRHFIVYVGRQDPYKGLDYLVQAYALLPESLRQSYALVIAGKMDYRYIGDVQRLIEQLHLQQQVIFLDYVDDHDLPCLYTAATLLVHPSLYEGFGFPPLEAMACGTPVVYAKTSSLPELLGDAGYAVPPAVPEALAEGIRKLLESEPLRKSYAENGIQHVQKYSWQRVAREILDIYNDWETNSSTRSTK